MIPQNAGVYDSPYQADNVYGRTIGLLKQIPGQANPGEVHLDIGCGYGPIAEHVAEELGLTYVGVDGAMDGLESLRGRGFETHLGLLEGQDKTVNLLQQIIGDRKLRSISFLETIEHLPDAEDVLIAISRIAHLHSAHVVISTPNITHRDIGAKLALGMWNYTEFGLLDRTHVKLFDNHLLTETIKQASLSVVARNDIIWNISDQHFPAGHPALAFGASLNKLFFDLARQAHDFSTTYQFLCLCAPAEQAPASTFLRAHTVEIERPLLTVLIRTQGERTPTLTELFTALSAQLDDDFEVLVVGHDVEEQKKAEIERLIGDTPEFLRSRIRLIFAAAGSRSHPLNLGFAEARGRYIAIADDDDLPMAHWVSTFRALHDNGQGKVLRCVAARQNVREVTIDSRRGLRAVGPFEKVYPRNFSEIDHLAGAETPSITLAFPRGAFHNLGLRFDDELSSLEDWDFFLRVSAVCGVVSSPEFTGVDRAWQNEDGAHELMTQEAAQANKAAIYRKQDDMCLIATGEVIKDIRERVQKCRDLEDANAALKQDLAQVEAEAERAEAQRAASEHSFSIDHPAVAFGSSLNKLLSKLAQQADRVSKPYPFLGREAPTEQKPASALLRVHDLERPLVTALVRTQGNRTPTLTELFTALAAQHDPDFEVLVVGHNVEEHKKAELERVISDTPEFLRSRIRLIYLVGGGRSRPLNVGFAEARGRYIAITDDDDLPMAHWVETFRTLHNEGPGRVLRSVAARQNVREVTIGARRGLRAEGTLEQVYPKTFNEIDHLAGNESPPITLAFPRGAFHDLGFRFDEEMNTVEDWDFLLRVSAVCGVASSSQFTGVYRWWQNEECSRTVHSAEEWRENSLTVYRKQEEGCLIATGAIVKDIRERVIKSRELENAYGALNHAHHETIARAERAEAAVAESEARCRRLSLELELERDITRRHAADVAEWRHKARMPLSTNDQAQAWGQRLAGTMPPDLARALCKGLKFKIFMMKLRFYLSYPLAKKRRALRARRHFYRQFLRGFKWATHAD